MNADNWKRNKEMNAPRKIKDVDILKEKDKFFKALRAKYPQLTNKEYFYINIWKPFCYDCIDQIPKLDTLIEPLNSKMAYVAVSEAKRDFAMRKLVERNVRARNFLFINEADSFINALYEETKIKLRHKGYGGMEPMNIILDRTGKMLYYDTLFALSNYKSDSVRNKEFVIKLKGELYKYK